MTSPDLEGFVEAQGRLRQHMGRDVTFYVPVPPIYPAGTALDPETGDPYDPTVVPESGGGWSDEVFRVGVIFTPVASDEESATETRFAIRRTANMALALDPGAKDVVEDASEFELDGIRYVVTDLFEDPGPDNRWLMFGEAK